MFQINLLIYINHKRFLRLARSFLIDSLAGLLAARGLAALNFKVAQQQNVTQSHF
jgi:hypothetical protein